MKLHRRGFVKASGIALAASQLPLTSQGASASAGVTVIWDSRLDGVAQALPRAERCVDLASLSDDQWFRLAASLPTNQAVVGYTDWSSFVLLRDALREQGRRLKRREERIDQHSGRSLFVWQMA